MTQGWRHLCVQKSDPLELMLPSALCDGDYARLSEGSVLMLVSVLLRSGVCTSFPLNLSGFNECFVMYNMAQVILCQFSGQRLQEVATTTSCVSEHSLHVKTRGRHAGRKLRILVWRGSVEKRCQSTISARYQTCEWRVFRWFQLWLGSKSS